MSQPVADKPHPALFGDASIDHAVAGFGAGTVATLVMHPLDLIKVRFQLATVPRVSPSTAASPSTATSTFPSSIASSSRHPLNPHGVGGVGGVIPSTRARLGTGVYLALRDAVRLDGWKGLYRGLVPNLVGGASSWGLYFLFL